jgi:hypothetical protein
VARNVSQYRRAALEEEVNKGIYRDGSGPVARDEEPSAGGYATYSVGKQPMSKYANLSSTLGTNTSAQWQGGMGDTVRQAPEVYSPLWLNSNLNLPRDRATINAWCRSFYALNPFVNNAINLHSTYPISKMTIRCPDKRVEKFFNEMIDEIDLMNVCVQIAQEFWLLGESFIYAELDERNLRWSRLRIQNPDYVVVSPSVISSEPIIMLRPDANLRRIVFSQKPSDLEQKKQLGPHIIEYVKRGQNIPLDNFYVSHLARRISPYESRGTGLPVAFFRQLMLFDKLRESKFAQADNMINPLTLVKVGSPEFKPSPQQIDSYREIFEAAQYDKDFKIFTNDAVTVERIGSGQGIYDISGDITQLIKEIWIGLMVPSVLMDGGQDTTYANGGVALDVLRQRYMQFRNMLSTWLRRKIFAPISKLNEFYVFHEKQKHLIIPEIDWNHMSLFDAGDYIQNLVHLTDDVKNKRVSNQTLYRSLGLEFEEEVRKMRKEDVQDAIRKKEQVSLQKMPLNELRTLGDEDEIPETAEAPLPGETPGGDDDGGGGGGDLPGAGGGGGMPDLGAPPGGGPPGPPGAPPGGPPGGEAGAGAAPPPPPPK